MKIFEKYNVIIEHGLTRLGGTNSLKWHFFQKHLHNYEEQIFTCKMMNLNYKGDQKSYFIKCWYYGIDVLVAVLLLVFLDNNTVLL